MRKYFGYKNNVRRKIRVYAKSYSKTYGIHVIFSLYYTLYITTYNLSEIFGFVVWGRKRCENIFWL